MDLIKQFVIGDSVANYVAAGFSETEARAMSYIALQRPKGRFYGFLFGSFMAYSWGHWHQRIQAYFPIKFKRMYFQAFILALGIITGDYLYGARRTGANEYFGNKMRLNTNLLYKNIDKVVDNFEILNRKFSPQEVQAFNFRSKSMSSVIPLQERKWVFNENIQTREQFEKRIKKTTQKPWQDTQIRQSIRNSNPQKDDLVYTPVKLDSLIDETGQRIGIATLPYGNVSGWTNIQ